MAQIKEQEYAVKIANSHIGPITGFGIACYKKNILVLQDELYYEPFGAVAAILLIAKFALCQRIEFSEIFNRGLCF